MINGHDLYAIVTAMVPLYVAMFLAYGSVKWWKIFTPDQCSGINRFVAIFAVPFLSFHFISMNNPYTMNFRFLTADTLQKIITLLVLAFWAKFTKTGNFEWLITIFSLATLPNTLVIGIPLLTAMYGASAASLMVQVVVLQCIIWYTLLLFFFEFRGAKKLIMEQFPETGADIVSFKVDSDVVSLDGQDLLETEADVGDDGKLHVTVRKSNASRKLIRTGSLLEAEIYSLSSSALPTPRGSDFNQSDFYTIGFPGGRLSNFGPAADLYSVHWSRDGTPRLSNFEDDPAPTALNMTPYFQPVNSEINPGVAKGKQLPQMLLNSKTHLQHKDNHEKNMFIRSSSTSVIVKNSGLRSDLRPTTEQSFRSDQHGANRDNGDTGEFRNQIGGDKERIRQRIDSAAEHHGNTVAVTADEGSGKQLPAARVMSRLIVTMVWRKLVRNPNTYASIIGLVWALVSFRWDVKMPKIIAQSISLISNAGLGMAMFSLGLFMALQPKLIACGRSKALLAMGVKFVLGPVVMWVSALIVQLHTTLFRISIVQAALSVGIVPFVFAKEYNVHPTILSTSVIFGMLITVPITICYYILLQLKN